MPWSDEQKVDFLMRLPWTIELGSEDGEAVLRVVEVPGVVVQDADRARLGAELWASLEASLYAILHFGDPIPRPKGFKAPFPWESDFWPSPQRSLVFQTGGHVAVRLDSHLTGSVSLEGDAVGVGG